jgi:hypothetical protein
VRVARGPVITLLMSRLSCCALPRSSVFSSTGPTRVIELPLKLRSSKKVAQQPD